jgi:hypothetical protein
MKNLFPQNLFYLAIAAQAIYCSGSGSSARQTDKDNNDKGLGIVENFKKLNDPVVPSSLSIQQAISRSDTQTPPPFGS